MKREFVKPTAQCWSSRGEVFVGCKGGQLFRVDGESGQSAVILGGTSGVFGICKTSSFLSPIYECINLCFKSETDVV